MAEDDDTFDLVGERPAQEQPVGPDRVGSDPCPGRRFREQWPAGALGEDPGRRAGVVARDHDRALPAPEHLHPRPPPEHLDPRPPPGPSVRPGLRPSLRLRPDLRPSPDLRPGLRSRQLLRT